MIEACWSEIGVRGDSSCVELATLVHCRNCERYSRAARELLDVEIPATYAREATERVAAQRRPQPATRSIVMFRSGDEPFALSTRSLCEIAEVRRVHSLPHRDGAILGVINVRGRLLVCISLPELLALPMAPPALGSGASTSKARLLVLERDSHRIVLPVDEVYGVERYDPSETLPVPATTVKAGRAYTQALVRLHGRDVRLLDIDSLFDAFDSRLASNAI